MIAKANLRLANLESLTYNKYMEEIYPDDVYNRRNSVPENGKNRGIPRMHIDGEMLKCV